jgi:mannose/fructose/N-acetylgalactosamine-specific phosphotransferase system component IID
MEINLPNSAWIGNIDPFLKSFKTKKENELIITSHEKWISVHPVVLAMIAGLGLKITHTHPKNLHN